MVKPVNPPYTVTRERAIEILLLSAREQYAKDKIDLTQLEIEIHSILRGSVPAGYADPRLIQYVEW